MNLNPKIDFVFRKLFGSEENKDLLLSLINSVVEPNMRLVDLTIKNPYNLAAYQADRESILDIKAEDQSGAWYDIEMQVTPHVLYGKRALYYLSKVYTDQMVKGADYSSLNATIGIHFLDFRYFPEDDRIVRQFVLKDADTNEAPKQLSYLQLYFVEMAKFDKDWSEVRTMLERWVAFLNKARELNLDRLPAQLTEEPAIVKAATTLERFGLTAAEREIYEGEVKKTMVDQLTLNSVREEGAQRILLHLLSRRIGEVPRNIAARLRDLSGDELDDLGVALFDFNSYADVEQWLTR